MRSRYDFSKPIGIVVGRGTDSREIISQTLVGRREQERIYYFSYTTAVCSCANNRSRINIINSRPQTTALDCLSQQSLLHADGMLQRDRFSKLFLILRQVLRTVIRFIVVSKIVISVIIRVVCQSFMSIVSISGNVTLCYNVLLLFPCDLSPITIRMHQMLAEPACVCFVQFFCLRLQSPPAFSLTSGAVAIGKSNAAVDYCRHDLHS